MDRAQQVMLAFIALVACLAAGCGGSGWLTLQEGSEEGIASVSISAMAIYRVVGSEDEGVSKDAVAVGGGGTEVGEWDEETMRIYESTGGLCNFQVGHFSSPGSYVEVFDSRSGHHCAEAAGDPERCLDCTIVLAAGNCSLECTGSAPMNTEAAAESIEVTVENISTFKARAGSGIGALALKSTISEWPEADMTQATGSEESHGIDLKYCNGGNDLIKADPADPESLETLSPREWRYLVTITDLGKDTDGDGLTACLIRNWVTTSISLAGVDTEGSLSIERGPIRFITHACSDPSACAW